VNRWPLRCVVLRHIYEMRPRKDHRGVDLISDVLPCGALWYAEPNAVSNAIGYARFYSRSHDAVIRVYDSAGNVIETHEHAERVQRAVCGSIATYERTRCACLNVSDSPPTVSSSCRYCIACRWTRTINARNARDVMFLFNLKFNNVTLSQLALFDKSAILNLNLRKTIPAITEFELIDRTDLLRNNLDSPSRSNQNISMLST
jgi:hypothetical protein